MAEIPTLLQELKTKFGTIPELKGKYGADGEEAERGGEDAAKQPQRHGLKVLMALSARRFVSTVHARTILCVHTTTRLFRHPIECHACIHTFMRIRDRPCN